MNFGTHKSWGAESCSAPFDPRDLGPQAICLPEKCLSHLLTSYRLFTRCAGRLKQDERNIAFQQLGVLNGIVGKNNIPTRSEGAKKNRCF
jgi:hypothetical protein